MAENFKTRSKNALTEYFIKGSGSEDFLQLASYITSVTNETEDEVEDIAYYDGDGTLKKELLGVSKSYSFEGFYSKDDGAMALVRKADISQEPADRAVVLRVKLSDGTTLEGPATMTDIITTGGEASEYESFEVTISFDIKPTVVEGE